MIDTVPTRTLGVCRCLGMEWTLRPLIVLGWRDGFIPCAIPSKAGTGEIVVSRMTQNRKAVGGSKISIGGLFILCEASVAIVLSTCWLSTQYLPSSFWLRGILTDFVILHYLILVFVVFQRRTGLGLALLAGLGTSIFIIVQLKYIHLNDWFRLSDFLLVNEITLVFSPLLLTAVGMIALGWLVGLALNLRLPRLGVGLLVLSPALLYALLLLAFPTQLQTVLNVIHQHKSFRGNSYLQKGALFSLLWDAASTSAEKSKLREIERRLKGVEAGQIFDEQATIRAPRNIYIIVMESFMDPLELDYEYSPDPIDPWLREMLGGNSYSPVYGGGTAQAEFEILCGVPSFRPLGIVEFDQLSGGSVPCLPSLLKKHGFSTRAFTATDPSIFNAGKAYASLGFSESVEARPDSPADLDWKHLTNDRLFKQVKSHIQARRGQEPALNYIVTLSGHQPYRMNDEIRPSIVRLEGPALVRAMADNLYYSSRSLAKFIVWLREEDPESIIVAIGDHQGALFGIDVKYTHSADPGSPAETLQRYRVPYLVINRGRPQHLGTISHYEVPHIVLSLLTEKPYVVNRLPENVALLRPIREITFFATLEGRLGVCPNPEEPGCLAVEESNTVQLAKLLKILTAGRSAPPVL